MDARLNDAITELHDEQLRTRRLLALLDEGVATLDANGRLVSANAAMARMLGYDTPHDLVGVSLRDVYAGPAAVDSLLTRLAADGTLPRAVAELLSRTGPRVTVLLRGHTLQSRTGHDAAFEIVCTDVTAERRLEQQARQDAQLVIGGTWAAGAVVELRRLIAMMTATHKLLSDAIERDRPQHADLEHLRDTTARALALTEEFLATTRRLQVRPANIDAGAVLERLLPTIEQTVGGEITLRPSTIRWTGQVTFAPAELDQLLLELVSVARGLEPDAALMLTTAPVYLDATYAREHLALTPGHYVTFVVTTSTQSLDTLTPPDWEAERAFGPEAIDRHTAAELANVYRLANQGGGHLAVRRGSPAGTTFKVYLPRVDSPGRLGTILLVEDEPSIRLAGRQLLEILGYSVLEAADPHEAIWLAARLDGEIDLLIADVVLPGMTGREMAERLVDAGYVSNVLYMSGLLKETLVARAALPPNARFIEKPFTMQELMTRVTEILGPAPVDGDVKRDTGPYRPAR